MRFSNHGTIASSIITGSPPPPEETTTTTTGTTPEETTTTTSTSTTTTEAATPFLLTIQTTSNDQVFNLGNSSTNGYIDWGDGTEVAYTSTSYLTHNYTSPGTYQISFLGTIYNIVFDSGVGSAALVKSVDSWGSNPFTLVSNMFKGCSALTSIAADGDFSLIDTFSGIFEGCASLSSLPVINAPNAVNFNRAFYSCSTLTNVNFPDSSPSSYESAFYGCFALGTIVFSSIAPSNYPLILNSTALPGDGLDSVFNLLEAGPENAHTGKYISVIEASGINDCHPALVIDKWYIDGIPPYALTVPTITGTKKNGYLLTAVLPTYYDWTNQVDITGYEYQWYQGDTTIVGATSSTYIIDNSNVGNQIRVLVSAINTYGASSRTSALTTTIAQIEAPENLSPPSISGLLNPSETLTCSAGSWIPGVGGLDFSYQWYDCNSDGSAINAALGTAATETAAGIGHYMKCVVTCTNDGGYTSASSSVVLILEATTTTTEETTTTTEETTTTTTEETTTTTTEETTTTTTEETTTTTEETTTTTYMPYGTPLGGPYCSGYDLVQEQADGNGGQFTAVLEANSASCGYPP